MFNKAIKFLREVINELKRVSWPGKREVIGSTIVVIILVGIVAVFIGFVDFLLLKILALFLI